MQLRSFHTMELELSNFISKFYKENVGKGPKSVNIKFADNTIIYIVEGLLTLLEKNMLNCTDGKTIVEKGRHLIVNNWRFQRLNSFEKIIKQKIIDEHVVIDVEKDTAIGIVILESRLELSKAVEGL
ncbi:Na-translocating system protein MpsC family protein [Paenibacillus senegalimassiliensis]|uniref:Na-translocating system protein MpsC family protein n=1 Tax=Paenibacillus senegalimassiliensis TaxID=1737426 RepID=UPI00073F0F18|nr:Na-translocating system protein MpsC family protein [Paenibacillus senegalimassiliensis]